MAKKYIRKQVSSLDQLDREQERIKNRTRRMETEWLELLNPQQLAITLVGNFLSKKLSGKKTGQDFVAKDKESGYRNNAGKAKDKIGFLVKHPLVKLFLKKVGISFLKWQAFNLAILVGEKIYKASKARNEAKKIKSYPVRNN